MGKLPLLITALTTALLAGSGRSTTLASPPQFPQQAMDHSNLNYFNDWGMMAGNRPTQPTCVDIPRNMTLCHDIGYSKMRLPNLLEHDTMAEVSQQAASWVPLLNIKCHPDTQLFLCSLFSPVCLDRPIYPCRSLCEQVKGGCEGRMKVYGFPWPDILRCEKFPLDNDMCIAAQSTNPTVDSSVCKACRQAETYENILDNFCTAEFAVKTKVRKVKKSKIICRKGKVLKSSSTDKKELRALRRPTFRLDKVHECCSRFGQDSKTNYLIMGVRKGSDLVPTFVMEWRANSKAFRNAVRMFKKLDCADPKMLSESMLSDGSSPSGISASDVEKHKVSADSAQQLLPLEPPPPRRPTNKAGDQRRLPNAKRGQQQQHRHVKRTTVQPKTSPTDQ